MFIVIRILSFLWTYSIAQLLIIKKNTIDILAKRSITFIVNKNDFFITD